MSLVLRKLKVELGSTTLFTINAEVAPGAILTVMGASGSGKSTLLNAIAGFLEPSFSMSGQIVLDGTDLTHVPPQKRRVGLMFQDALLFPHMSVGENLAFALAHEPQFTRTERMAKVAAALRDIGLTGYETRDPATLSGGQQSRVALMRTLLAEPALILMDEPFSRLDTALREEIRNHTFARVRAANIPAILVTHDHADAEAAGGAVVTI